MQQPLSASVMVANDIPTLHIMEAYQDASCHEETLLHHYRLDTVEDNESMSGTVQLPHSPGQDSFALLAVDSTP